MKEVWRCRDFQIGDEDKILGLYQQVNKRVMTLPVWRWKFSSAPFGPPIIKLMFDGETLIGHYAVKPMSIQIGDIIVSAALSMNTMTDPGYEKQGVFTYLAKEAYKECQKRDLMLVYGFPNEKSHHGFIKRLGWKDFGKLTIVEKNLKKPTQKLPSQPSSRIHPISSFDNIIDSLWNKVHGNYNVIVPRTSMYLNWRFVEHPIEKYASFVIEDSKHGLSGYFVLKKYSIGGETVGHIVDMLCLDDIALARDMIRYSENYFIDAGISKLSCWAAERSFYGSVLTEEDYHRQEFGAYFGVMVFDKKAKNLQMLNQQNNWHLTMSDLDVV